MPIYEYQCDRCDQCFSVQARMSEAQPSQGPNCEGGACKIRKRLSRVYGQVAGANPAPRPIESPKPAPRESPSHVCSKYCDLHK